MTINFIKYIDITSSVAAGQSVRQRDLIARLFTTNNLLPPSSAVEFTSAAEVGTYFGTLSEEYLRALFYFSWQSKPPVRRAQKISFARWVNAAVAPRVYGKVATYSLTNFTSVSAGSLKVTMGSTTLHEITGVDLSAAASLADVASAVQTAVRAYSAGGANFTAATVTYDATRKSFNLVGGQTGDSPMAIAAGVTGTDIASRLGWLAGSIQAAGSAIVSITDTLQASYDASSNFGSFLFMTTLTLDQVTEAAQWNDAQNVQFIFSQRVVAADAVAWSAALLGISGVGLTLAPLAAEYPEMAPMMIMAATDYNALNSVQNYMFQQFTLTPSVTTTADSDQYDSLRVNYYGRTQDNGQFIDFYQRGLLMGLQSDPVDMNTYANESWLKSWLGASLMTLFLALPKISANKAGQIQLQTVLQVGVAQGLNNGTVSTGKPLTTTQQLVITEITGDVNAWQQVQNIGYWLNVQVASYVTEDARTEWKATYTLIYSKDDDVRKVEGTNTLI